MNPYRWPKWTKVWLNFPSTHLFSNISHLAKWDQYPVIIMENHELRRCISGWIYSFEFSLCWKQVNKNAGNDKSSLLSCDRCDHTFISLYKLWTSYSCNIGSPSNFKKTLIHPLRMLSASFPPKIQTIPLKKVVSYFKNLLCPSNKLSKAHSFSFFSSSL